MATKSEEFKRTFRARRNGPHRDLHGKRCRIVEWGSARCAVLVEFETGERLICSRWAVNRLR